jgi:hypothetical protein
LSPSKSQLNTGSVGPAPSYRLERMVVEDAPTGGQAAQDSAAEAEQVEAKPLTGWSDESYTQRDYWVAVVVADDAQKTALETSFSEIRAEVAERWGLPSDVEFHAHDIMQGWRDWEVFQGRFGDAVSLCRRLLNAVADSGVRIALQGVDVVRLNLRFQYPALPHEVAARRALEQVDQWCAHDGGGPVTLIADETGDNPSMTSLFDRIIDGTSLAVSSGYPRPLTHLTRPVALVSSARHDGVQAADLAVHIVRRHIEETTAAPRARKLARSLYHTLSPAIAYESKWRP